MEKVLTLVSTPGGLTAGHIAAARDALRGAHASVSPPDWLAEETACDLLFSGISADFADAVVRPHFSDAGVDLFFQPVENRRKQLLIADMDSTMVTGETLDDLAAFAGLKDKIAAITERAMRGELDFEEALRERVGMLKGLSADALERTWEEIRFMPGAHTLVQTMRANGAHCILASGGFTFFTGRVAAACGFHEHHANTLILEDGKLTGEVGSPILGKDAKLRLLMEGAGARHLPLSLTAAVGDGANDLPMLQAAALGVAYHAKPLVRDSVAHKVNAGNLTALLFAQGYKATEFVTAP